MFLRDYVQNPTGKGSAIYPVKEVSKKFNEDYEEIKDKIKHKVYEINGFIYIYVKIPSSVPSIDYDVILRFDPRNGAQTLIDMDFSLFSNCPSFVYTFAYAYNKRGILLNKMQNKFTKYAVKTAPETRNPYEIIGFEFSTYLAIKHIMKKKLFILDSINPAKIKMTKLVGMIQKFDALIKKRNLIEQRERDKKKKDQNKIKMSNVTREEKKEKKPVAVTKAKTVKKNKVVKRSKAVKRR